MNIEITDSKCMLTDTVEFLKTTVQSAGPIRTVALLSDGSVTLLPLPNRRPLIVNRVPPNTGPESGVI